MGLLQRMKRLVSGGRPTFVDFEQYEPAATGTDGNPAVLRRVGPGGMIPEPGTYKLQHSYDSLLETVQALRAALDGQAKRQEELLARLSTLPHAVEALPQTSKMQSDMLKVINDRLAMHVEQQRQLSDTLTTLGTSGKENKDALQHISDQLETGNEIDRQLVESFNRFSMMIDRLQLANNGAVDCLQQVRESYAQSAVQMQEWVEKSRQRNNWMIVTAFGLSLLAVICGAGVCGSPPATFMQPAPRAAGSTPVFVEQRNVSP
jgi:CRP-like cAMP-binding protein